jgi:hypothetical protein
MSVQRAYHPPGAKSPSKIAATRFSLHLATRQSLIDEITRLRRQIAERDKEVTEVDQNSHQRRKEAC